ncbi:HAD family hydrolase [Planococcus halotolerans]|uniref:HAD family hydrolase n=1 Tax=Planococcus halotolerans TaxID=2233542 RepID=UPI0010923682|nr:HAD family hydrolase [Planococcus halotolerans]QHJ70040.1 HAD-IA family hydrolase [Planococcus halotolerans]
MIKAVIFDLDGTLLDRDKSVEKFIYGQHKRLESALGHIDQSHYTQRFLELDNHGYVWKDKVYQQLIEEFDITGMSKEQLLKDYLTHFAAQCVPFPHLVPMLKELKTDNILLGMITNGYTDFQSGNIEALGIEQYFDAILISEKEGLRKPDKRIFEKALERLGVQADQAIFVGDHPTNDVEASANAGMTSVWKRNLQWETADAHFIIDGLDEIPGLVQKLEKQAELGIKRSN